MAHLTYSVAYTLMWSICAYLQWSVQIIGEEVDLGQTKGNASMLETNSNTNTQHTKHTPNNCLQQTIVHQGR